MSGDELGNWTWRETVATWFHRIGYMFSPIDEHDILIRDDDGRELFNIAFCGSFVATGPSDPYTLHCRHYEGDDDIEGTEHAL